MGDRALKALTAAGGYRVVRRVVCLPPFSKGGQGGFSNEAKSPSIPLY